MLKKLLNLTSPKSQQKADHIAYRQRHSMHMEQQFIDAGIRPGPVAPSKIPKVNSTTKIDSYWEGFEKIKTGK